MTRGTGILEEFLSKKRFETASNLLDKCNEKERILDIGCASVPYFLKLVDFKEKIGLDKIFARNTNYGNIKLIRWDIKNKKLPFRDTYFDAISLLAVIEHIELKELHILISECERVLKKRGVLVITTPSKISKNLLHALSLFNIVSKEEILEHKLYFTRKSLGSLLKGIFKDSEIKTGTFELLLNIWAYAIK